MKTQSWHWPDRTIGKRESRRLREEHNAAVNLNAELLESLNGLMRCFWDGRPKRNVKKDYHLMVQVEAARAAIAKAKGE